MKQPYDTFKLKAKVEIEDWEFCAFMSYIDKDAGDAYVIAPSGKRAGIVWGGNSHPAHELLPPDEDRWGVYYLPFKLPMRNLEALKENFESALPYLKDVHKNVFGKEC